MPWAWIHCRRVVREVGVAEQVGGDADLLGRTSTSSARRVPEQVGRDRLAEGLLGAPRDLALDRLTRHRPAPAVDPEVPFQAADRVVPACNRLHATDLEPLVEIGVSW
jgi:hypothetical protein